MGRLHRLLRRSGRLPLGDRHQPGPDRPDGAALSNQRDRLLVQLADAESRIAGLDAGLAEIKATSESSNADDEHDPEGATIAFERQQLSALLDGARRSRAELRTALAHMDDGSYGICDHCGRPIAPERLEARLQAMSCIDCARAGRD